jgi:hypothetical protein
MARAGFVVNVAELATRGGWEHVLVLNSTVLRRWIPTLTLALWPVDTRTAPPRAPPEFSDVGWQGLHEDALGVGADRG